MSMPFIPADGGGGGAGIAANLLPLAGPFGVLYAIFGGGNMNFQNDPTAFGAMRPELVNWFKGLQAPVGTPPDLLKPIEYGIFQGVPKWIPTRLTELGFTRNPTDSMLTVTKDPWWMNFIKNPLSVITAASYAQLTRPFGQQGTGETPTEGNQLPPGQSEGGQEGTGEGGGADFSVTGWGQAYPTTGATTPGTFEIDPITGLPRWVTTVTGLKDIPYAQSPIGDLTPSPLPAEPAMPEAPQTAYPVTPAGGTPTFKTQVTGLADIPYHQAPIAGLTIPPLPAEPPLPVWDPNPAPGHWVTTVTGRNEVPYDPSPITGVPTPGPVPGVDVPPATGASTGTAPGGGGGLNLSFPYVSGGAGPAGPTAPVVGGGPPLQSIFQPPQVTQAPPTLLDFMKILGSMRR